MTLKQTFAIAICHWLVDNIDLTMIRAQYWFQMGSQKDLFCLLIVYLMMTDSLYWPIESWMLVVYHDIDRLAERRSAQRMRRGSCNRSISATIKCAAFSHQSSSSGYIFIYYIFHIWYIFILYLQPSNVPLFPINPHHPDIFSYMIYFHINISATIKCAAFSHQSSSFGYFHLWLTFDFHKILLNFVTSTLQIM